MTKKKQPVVKAKKLPTAELKGNKFKLIVPNSAIEQKLLQTAGCCRKVWNVCLAMLKADRQEYNDLVNMSKMNGGNDVSIIKSEFGFAPYAQLSKILTEIKTESEFSYLNDVHSKSLQITLEELGQATKEANDPTNIKKFPKFKKHSDGDIRFSFNGSIKHDKIHHRVFIPKLGVWLTYKFSYKNSQRMPELIKNVTICKENNLWYVSFQTEDKLQRTTPCLANTNQAIAIDVGVAKVVSLSREISFEYQQKILTGKQFDSLKLFMNNQARMEFLQQKLDRQDPLSNGYKKTNSKINKLHKKIANTRKDFNHKLSRALVDNFAYIMAENLKICNMTKSAAGTVTEPGVNVAAKSGLNRSILEQGWGQLFQFINYKLEWKYGLSITQVNPKNTSLKCSGCGHIHKDNRKNQAEFKCLECGMDKNADLNAAINILVAGLAMLADGVVIAGRKRFFAGANDGNIYEFSTSPNRRKVKDAEKDSQNLSRNHFSVA